MDEIYVVDIYLVHELLWNLRSKVWDIDIPSPTVPEYIEHHNQMQDLLKEVDKILDEIDECSFIVEV